MQLGFLFNQPVTQICQKDLQVLYPSTTLVSPIKFRNVIFIKHPSIKIEILFPSCYGLHSQV